MLGRLLAILGPFRRPAGTRAITTALEHEDPILSAITLFLNPGPGWKGSREPDFGPLGPTTGSHLVALCGQGPEQRPIQDGIVVSSNTKPDSAIRSRWRGPGLDASPVS